MAQTVRELGEQAIRQRLARYCPPEMIGDDGAVVALQQNNLVISTDVLVDGVHFSDRTTSGFDVGWRAAAANLSDLAAMGATPIGITVGLALPETTSVSWLDELYVGMQACLEPHQAQILGGDLVRSQIRTLAITAIGTVEPKHVIARNAAQVGDSILVTGPHGVSKAGLELLLYPEKYPELAVCDRNYLLQAHQRPQPRLDILPQLRLLSLSRAIAGMDSSDGLADAVCQICWKSGVGAELDKAQLPIPDVLTQLATSETVEDWVLFGGEDFELVLCLPTKAAEQLVTSLGSSAKIVGRIIPGEQVVLREGQFLRSLSLDDGFQHFA
ncbi:MAG: thiamine-phosphate kinase [Cyanobacteria bacterium P01_H01_bin.15]